MTYIINVGTYPGIVLENWRGHMENRYAYNSMKRPPNFVSKTRVEQGSVNSLAKVLECK